MATNTPQQQEIIEQIKAGILAKLQEHGGGLSFVDLEEIRNFSGSFAMELGQRNIFYWFDVSQEACVALQALQDDGLISFSPTYRLIYAIDGKLPGLPLVRKSGPQSLYRKQGKSWAYKKPHWLPMTIDRGENYRNLTESNAGKTKKQESMTNDASYG